MSELRLILTAAALLAAMAIAIWLGRRHGAGIVLLALLAIVWFQLDRDFEGPTLIRIGENHGIVLADLVGIAALAVAVWLWVLNRSAAQRPSRPEPDESRRTPR